MFCCVDGEYGGGCAHACTARLNATVFCKRARQEKLHLRRANQSAAVANCAEARNVANERQRRRAECAEQKKSHHLQFDPGKLRKD